MAKQRSALIQAKAKQAGLPREAMARDPRPSVRQTIAPFSRLDIAGSASPYSLRSKEIAESMAIIYGPRTATAERYLAAAGYAPAWCLQALKKRRCALLLAPSVAAGYATEAATLRRGWALGEEQMVEVELLYGQGSGIVAVYEPDFDALILPTAETSDDAEHTILHEIGHALTYRQISKASRPELYPGLPWEIEAHIQNPLYSGDPRRQVSEILAESFVWMVVGRRHELPPAVVSELVGMLPLDAEPPPLDLF
jgi:hypothetical protein